jgi:hypothetical protein
MVFQSRRNVVGESCASASHKFFLSFFARSDEARERPFASAEARCAHVSKRDRGNPRGVSKSASKRQLRRRRARDADDAFVGLSRWLDVRSISRKTID